MKKTLAVLMLALLVSASFKALAYDETENRGYLTYFVKNFDELQLGSNESRWELKWFLEQGKETGTFLRDSFNDDKDKMKTRMAALFILCKGWPELSERFLAKAEASSKPELAEFGKRLRAYIARPALKEVKKKFDNTQAYGYLKDLTKGFEETDLGKLNARAQVAWFFEWGNDGYDFLEGAVNNGDLSWHERMAALFVLVKGWRDRSWNELRRAESDKHTDFSMYAKRVRAYFGVPVEKPKTK
ncbi:MAG: hypothetical protein KIS92_17345 [Planctomycetota bacterium]|nr:hypothetical protein [Planctomycetota bacterium]